jgi:hypothetical protein
MRLAAGLQRVARGVDRVEQRLLLVEIGPVDDIAQPHDPARVALLPADLEFHDPHLRPPGRRTARANILVSLQEQRCGLPPLLTPRELSSIAHRES